MHVAGIDIREARPDDGEAIWRIFRRVIAPGDTYAFAPDMQRDAALAAWLPPGRRTYVALRGDHVVGTYILTPNQPSLGSHVANAAFMVDPQQQRRGVGRLMGEHALAEARRLGYRAMQFNFVVATNLGAVALWKDLGFDIIATLPGAFQHQRLGYVDAYIMHRSLLDG